MHKCGILYVTAMQISVELHWLNKLKQCIEHLKSHNANQKYKQIIKVPTVQKCGICSMQCKFQWRIIGLINSSDACRQRCNLQCVRSQCLRDAAINVNALISNQCDG